MNSLNKSNCSQASHAKSVIFSNVFSGNNNVFSIVQEKSSTASVHQFIIDNHSTKVLSTTSAHKEAVSLSQSKL